MTKQNADKVVELITPPLAFDVDVDYQLTRHLDERREFITLPMNVILCR